MHIRIDVHGQDIAFRYRFQPDSLPDPSTGGVENVLWSIGLFPNWNSQPIPTRSRTALTRNITRRVCRVMNKDDELVRLTAIDVFSNIGREPEVSPSMERSIVALLQSDTHQLIHAPLTLTKTVVS